MRERFLGDGHQVYAVSWTLLSSQREHLGRKRFVDRTKEFDSGTHYIPASNALAARDEVVSVLGTHPNMRPGLNIVIHSIEPIIVD